MGLEAPERKPDLARRRLIFGGAAAVGLAAIGITGAKVRGTEVKNPEKPPEMVATPRNLQGRLLSDLYALYTGIDGRVPETINADFPSVQLPKLWEAKRKRFGETPAVKDTRETLIKSYDQKRAEKMGWQDYRARAQASIDLVRRSLDWNAVGREFGVKGNSMNLLRAFESQITGAHLLAYCLTELMPGRDGKLHRDMLDFLLRQGGRDYVERIPAVFDSKTSFGPYQFTEYALYDAGDDEKKRGASIPNIHVREREQSELEKVLRRFLTPVLEALPDWGGILLLNESLGKDVKIPGSVAKLRGDDHHKAAYLFAIHNLALLVRSIPQRDQSALVGRVGELRAPIAEYIATAHNLPNRARPNFRSYLTAFLGRDPRRQSALAKATKKPARKRRGKSLSSIKLGRDADYLEHVHPRIKEYARKTRINYRVVAE